MHGLEGDMSRLRNCHGNAVAESFFPIPEVSGYHKEDLLNARNNEARNF